VPQKLEQCMASKHYLSATDMLVSLCDRSLLLRCKTTLFCSPWML
jgi:hypothetical protein